LRLPDSATRLRPATDASVVGCESPGCDKGRISLPISYGSYVQADFGLAGFPFVRSLTLYLAATHFRVRATEVASTKKGNTMTTPNLEQDLLRANDLLRCAAATAYETSDHLTGQKRDLACSVMHLVEMAQGLIERSLSSIEAR